MIRPTVKLTQAQLNSVCTQVRKSGQASNKFDINIVEGKLSEQIAETILTKGTKIEVKTDYLYEETGNIAIEFECRGKPSGIATTKADWWFIFLSSYRTAALLIETEKLKVIARYYWNMAGQCRVGGDDDKVKMVLVPFEDILKGTIL